MANVMGAQTVCCGILGRKREILPKKSWGFLETERFDMGHLSMDVSFMNIVVLFLFFLSLS